MGIEWGNVAQIVTIAGTAMFYGGRFLARLDSVEKSVGRIEGRVDELAGGIIRQNAGLVAAANALGPQRGRPQDKPREVTRP